MTSFTTSSRRIFSLVCLDLFVYDFFLLYYRSPLCLESLFSRNLAGPSVNYPFFFLPVSGNLSTTSASVALPCDASTTSPSWQCITLLDFSWEVHACEKCMCGLVHALTTFLHEWEFVSMQLIARHACKWFRRVFDALYLCFGHMPMAGVRSLNTRSS